MNVPANKPAGSVQRAAGDTPENPATIELDLTDDQALIVHASGNWSLDAPRPSVRELQPGLADRPRVVVLQTDGVGTWDSSLLSWFYGAIQASGAAGIEVDCSRLPHGIGELLRLAQAVEEAPRREEKQKPRFLARVGRTTAKLGHKVVRDFDFLGNVSLALARFVTFRAQFRRTDLFALLQSTGAEAVPIITLVSVIIGLILAFVGSLQLRLFGADLYVADLVGIATVREIGAMIVGVIMAGRTGAAFAAQLGAMKVSEEIDALTTFGISPIEFLVLPRVVALSLMTPLLCLYSMVLTIAGGAIVGVGMLGISTRLYFDQTLKSLTPDDFYGGMFRVSVYGVLISVTSCLCGMRCGSDAAAVGEATTTAVVASIVVMVIADGVMAVVFNALGI